MRPLKTREGFFKKKHEKHFKKKHEHLFYLHLYMSREHTLSFQLHRLI